MKDRDKTKDELLNELHNLRTFIADLKNKQKDSNSLSESLYSSEERYRILIENSPYCIHEINRLGQLISMNPAGLRLINRQNESEIIALPLIDVVSDNDKVRINDLLSRSLQGESFEFEFTAVNGSIFASSFTPIKDPNGDVIRLIGLTQDITKRTRAEETIKESEANLNSLINNRNDSIWSIDSHYNYLIINNHFRDDYFATFKIWLTKGMNALSILPSELQEFWKPKYDSALSGNKNVFEFSNQIRGELHCFEVSLNPITVNGKITGVSALSVDITARKFTERASKKAIEALRLNTEHQSLILKSLSLVFYTTTITEEMRTSWISEQVEQLTGFSPKHFTEDSEFWNSRLHPEDRDRVLKEYQSVFNKEMIEIEYRWQCADGSYRWFFDQITVSKDDRGIPSEIIGIWLDITYRKKTEELLRNSEQSYLGLFNTVTEAIYIHDKQGIFIDVNIGTEKMYGYSRNEIIGKTPEFLSAPGKNDLSYIGQILVEVFSTGEPRQFEFWGKRKNGEIFPKDVISNKGKYFGKDVIITTARDITEQKKAEDERKNLEEQLFRSLRMESIGTLASGIAHDFNNILTAIIGNASLISAKPADIEKTKQRSERILTSGDRGAQVVKQLMTLAQKVILQRKTTHINTLILEVSKLIDETFPKTIEMRLDLHPELPTIEADPNQLHQVLLNLCFNARDAMPYGGIITIETKTVLGKDIQKRISEAIVKDYIEIDIKDTGDGIDGATLQKIFDPFFTTKDIGKGSGLGLPVALGIIQKHNGYIDIDSAVGLGSTFSIFLPLGDQLGLGIEKDDPKIDDVKGGSETILVIEDEDQIRETTKEYLTIKGYKVITAVHGEDGVDVYVKHRSEISIILSDLGLPKITGEEVFRRIQTMNLDVPFLLFTGFIEPEKKKELLNLGVRSIIVKPAKPVEVLLKIREVLDNGKP